MFAKTLREENDSLIYQLAISNCFLCPGSKLLEARIVQNELITYFSELKQLSANWRRQNDV